MQEQWQSVAESDGMISAIVNASLGTELVRALQGFNGDCSGFQRMP
jgi:hypothetical protein